MSFWKTRLPTWQQLRNHNWWRAHYRWILVIAATVIAGTVLAFHARFHLPFFMDDSFISLRYSQRLLDGKGLTWNDNEPVEGYSNLLWVLLCAAIGAFGVDLVDSARVVGHASAFAAIIAVATTFGLWRTEQRPQAATLLTPLFLAISGCFGVWAVGGIETVLVAGCLSWGLACVFRIMCQEPPYTPRRTSWILAGIPLALLCLTRGDGPLMAGCVGIGVLIALHTKGLGGRIWRPRLGAILASVWLMLIPVSVSLAQLGFRLWYYGAWVPNTASAKVSFTADRFLLGCDYLKNALAPNKALIAIALSALIPLIADPKARSRLWVMVPLAIVIPPYVASIGGDFFPGRRHIVVLIVLAAFAAGEGIQWMMRRKKPATRTWAVWATIACLGLFLSDQMHDNENTVTQRYGWTLEGESIGNLFRKHFGPTDARLAVDAAGCTPYHSQLTTIDMLGLNDRYLATHPPPDWGKRNVGHDLGDGKYVLGREPDLVLFGLCRGGERPKYRSGHEMRSDRSFSTWYSLLNFEAVGDETLKTVAWTRNDSTRLGVDRTDVFVFLPGFVFASGDAVARKDHEGRLGVVTTASSPGKTTVRKLMPGKWEAEALSIGEPLFMSVSPRRQEAVSSSATGDPLTFAVTGNRPVDVDITLHPTGEGITLVLEVVLRMTDGTQ
ncbi:MAG: hypothetical protein FWD57_03360 [Polyangiaceae bacterium]|nr:hypothetical protein [Polyangiaceae bacterium]